MKKIVSVILIVSLILSLFTTAYANEENEGHDVQRYSVYAEDGSLITVVTKHSGDTAISEVYVSGVLVQSAIANKTQKR